MIAPQKDCGGSPLQPSQSRPKLPQIAPRIAEQRLPISDTTHEKHRAAQLASQKRWDPTTHGRVVLANGGSYSQAARPSCPSTCIKMLTTRPREQSATKITKIVLARLPLCCTCKGVQLPYLHRTTSQLTSMEVDECANLALHATLAHVQHRSRPWQREGGVWRETGACNA